MNSPLSCSAHLSKPSVSTLFDIIRVHDGQTCTYNTAERNEPLLVLNKVSVTIADTLILNDSSLVILNRHHYALIGPNGSGKTTLLLAIYQQLINNQTECRVEYVGQSDAEATAFINLSLIDYLLSEDPRRIALEQEISLLESDSENLSSIERLGELILQLEVLPTREEAGKILEQIGFSDNNQLVSTLSGGWRSRLEVARSLFLKPDVLLLDEPTNHLDIQAMLGLSRLLRRSPITSILVSHDAAFLDLTCTDIVCLGGQMLQHIPGNYTTFEEKAAEYRTFHEHLYEARKKQSEAVANSAQVMRKNAKKGKYVNDKALHQAAVREKKIERAMYYREDGKKFKTRSLKVMDENHVRYPATAAPIKETGNLAFSILPGTKQSPETVIINFSRKEIFAGSFCVLGDVELQVMGCDRIALLGKNGSGKTTLLKEITSAFPHRVGLIDQNTLASLSSELEITPLNWIHCHCPDFFTKESTARSWLARFGIGSSIVHYSISELSGGMRVRLCLARIMTRQPEVLLLDEPTNHLDGESIVALAECLENFDGAVVGVSHNCAFILQVFRSIWLCENSHVHINRCLNGTFVENFKCYAQNLVPKSQRTAIDKMMTIRAARSAIVVQQKKAATSLLIGQ